MYRMFEVVLVRIESYVEKDGMYGHVIKGVLCNGHKDGGLRVHLGQGGVLFCAVCVLRGLVVNVGLFCCW